MGVSMISPDGLAISPRIPASCRICCLLPRAPESAIMRIGLNSRRSRSMRFISRNIASDTLSVASDQIAMTLL
jgi:hypothetical protein